MFKIIFQQEKIPGDSFFKVLSAVSVHDYCDRTYNSNSMPSRANKTFVAQALPGLQ